MAAQLLMDVGHAGRAVACLKLALEQQPDDIDLATDIIRFERRKREQERAPLAYPAPPIVEAYTSAREQGGPVEVETAPLLALPILPSSEARISEVVPEVNEPIPQPRASAPRVPLEVEAPLMRWPEVRRISDTEVAIKPSPFSKWLVLTSSASIEVRFFDEFPIAEDAVWLE